MIKAQLIAACFAALGSVAMAASMNINGIEFVYRIPKKHSSSSHIMVLFGGRNWRGGKTLKVFNFDALADKYSIFLISPSFKDREYWMPEKWSGVTLQTALTALRKKYRINKIPVFFYGYSAGGQCASLFYNWMPDEVAAWGAHGCGVYPTQVFNCKAPALISCGVNDRERLQISRQFTYQYRESGGLLLWKPFFNHGHELNREALDIAKAWFDALLRGETPKYFGEDETGQVGGNIDIEFRNPLYNKKLLELWKK